MRGIFWNSRGLPKLSKRRFLAESSGEYKLDFIALLETGRDNFTSQFLSTISGGLDFDWHCLPPRVDLLGSYWGLNVNPSRSRRLLWVILLSNFICDY